MAQSGKKQKAAGRKKVKGGKGDKKASALLSLPARIVAPRLVFVLSVVFLCVLGLIMVYSSSTITAYSDSDISSSAYFFKRHLIFLLVGAVACAFLARVPYSVWGKPWVSWLLWGITILMLLLMLVVGNTKLGATRSLSVAGFEIQPTEFAKISVLILEASIIQRYYDGDFDIRYLLGQVLAVIVVTVVLIYLQPDLGTAMILFVGLLVLFYIGGMPWWGIAGIILIGVAYFIYVCLTQSYHLERLLMFLDPFQDAQGSGYQSVQGRLALGSGGLFGTGLGFSRQKYLYLPYAYNDFIYAIIGEELGLVGAALVLFAFLAFIAEGLRIARNSSDIFGSMLAAALVSMVGFQACLNMAMIVGVAPVTGKALPFISYGGSSLLSSLLAAGLVLSVSIHSRPDVRYERRRDDLRIIDGGSGGGTGTGRKRVADAAGSKQSRGVRAGSAGLSSSAARNTRKTRGSQTQTQRQTQTRSQEVQTSKKSSGGRISYLGARKRPPRS